MTNDPFVSPDNPSEVQAPESYQSERRRHLRFPFTASVDAVEPRSGTKLSGRTTDLSLGGCYIDALNPFPLGTLIKIRLTKEKVVFEADAKVIFSQVGMGMGVAFTSAVPKQVRIFQNWLNELTGKSSLESDAPEQTAKGAAKDVMLREQDYVLGELLIALMRKGVLSEIEGKVMLQKLCR